MGILATAPWLRGPLLLLRRPGVLVALLAAAFVATVPAAAAGPFLSSGRSATLHHQIDAACPWQVGARVTSQLYFTDPLTRLNAAPRADYDGQRIFANRAAVADAAAARVPALGPATTTLIAQAFGNDAAIPLWLVSRTGDRQHVQVLSGPVGEGLWITDEYAKSLHLTVGDQVTVQVEPGQPGGVAVPVAAVYRSLRQSPDVPYWCTMISYYRPPDSNRASPQMALLDPATLLRLGTTLGLVGPEFLEYPVRDPALSPDQARAAVTGIAAFRATVLDRSPWAFGQDVWAGTQVSSELTTFTGRADLARTGMLPEVVPITVAGVGIGLVVLAAAAVFWRQRRRQELTVLAAHGAGAVALGAKAVLEALPAVVAGAALGWGAAWWLVRLAGPDPVLSGEAAPLALAGAGATAIAGVAVVGLVAGIASRSLTDRVPLRRAPLATRIPWELGLLGAAPILWYLLGSAREVTDAPGGVGSVTHVPARLLAVPILVVAGVSVLVGRLGAGVLRRRGLRHTPRRPAGWLGWRRITRHAAMAATLAAATATPVALALYGATVIGSARTTVLDESRLRVGTDVVLTLSGPAQAPAALAGQATEVYRLGAVQVGGVTTDVLAVDPAGFARVAYWDDRLAGASLAAVLRPLAGGAAVGSTPLHAGSQVVTWLGSPALGGQVQVRVVGQLPAQRGGYPVLVVPTSALGDRLPYAERQLWVRGDPARIIPAVTAAHLPITRIQVASRQYVNTIWEPLTYTFGYLSALSLLTAVVAVVGLLLALEAQAPARRRGYVLLRRMGLSAAGHWRALLAELGLPLVLGLLLGAGLSTGLVLLLSGDFEPNPAVPPATVLDPPVRGGLAVALAVVVTAVVATGYAHRRIARARPAEVLRDTG